MASLATNQTPDITLDVKLDTPIELGVDINMAVVTIKESNGKTADVLHWLDNMEKHIAPQILGVTSGMLRQANPPETIY